MYSLKKNVEIWLNLAVCFIIIYKCVYSTAPKLPVGWFRTIPEEDRAWIAHTIFTQGTTGTSIVKPTLDRMRYVAPTPPLITTCRPQLYSYFGHDLFLWMPLRFWKVKLACTQPECNMYQLTLSGLHNTVRKVMSEKGFYLLATERLECGKCKSKYISWNLDIINQLDYAHRLQFPCILSKR